MSGIESILEYLYGRERGSETAGRLRSHMSKHSGTGARRPLSEKDALLITYGDMVSGVASGGGAAGLVRLEAFLSRWNRNSFSHVHILPFHPYTSDDGFSVVDYRQVDGRLGTWEDIGRLARSWRLAFDFVVNHGSVSSPWFQAFLRNEAPYRDWYLTRPAGYDASSVVRPRTHPLLTPFRRADGSQVHVWTTFSADQVDYDFSNPDVLLEFLAIFLEFAERGAKIIRLDAIAYLWKEDGTPCLHHPKTHTVVKLFRAVAEELGLDLILLTETNVPHDQNISYYGDGDEAHMVYNFALPPLVLHAAVSADAGPLRRWAAGLPPSGEGPLFLNFLASHDGVGLTPAAGLVDEAAFRGTLDKTLERGALISYKAVPGGSVPYELNCSYLSVVAPPELGSVELRARAFLACQGVLLCLAGLPAVYFHSWMGSEHWVEGPAVLGYNRAINREKPTLAALEAALADPSSLRRRVYDGITALLDFRAAEAAFAPDRPQEVLPAEGSLFALLRGPDEGGRRVLCLQNLGGTAASFDAAPQLPALGAELSAVTLEPWETRWIAAGGGRSVSVLKI